MAERQHAQPGGILGLVTIIGEHGGALDFDLLTMTRYSLDDVGGELPWLRLLHFVQHLPASSALIREIEPEQAMWSDGRRTADVLADIFDLLQSFQVTYISANSKRKAKRPKPYPRPWLKPKVRKFGSGAIPIKDFDAWWEGGK